MKTIVVAHNYRQFKTFIHERKHGTSMDQYKNYHDWIYVNQNDKDCFQLRGMRSTDIRLLVPYEVLHPAVKQELLIISNGFFKGIQ
jgi:hypothetical protein